MAIDYARAKREGPKLKRRLTLALKKENDRERQTAVYGACVAAVLEWERWGAWPDNWHRWQIALGDAGIGLRLEELPTLAAEQRAAALKSLGMDES